MFRGLSEFQSSIRLRRAPDRPAFLVACLDGSECSAAVLHSLEQTFDDCIPATLQTLIVSTDLRSLVNKLHQTHTGMLTEVTSFAVHESVP